jgi:bacillolysin
MSIRLRRRLPLVALIGIVVGAVLLAVGASSPTEAQQPTAGSSQQLSQLNSEGARVHRHQETGEVRFIGASKDNPIDRPAGLPENASPEAAARAHMAKLGELFGIQNQAEELRAEGSQELDGGRANTHFQQVHEGVPVLGGELNTQVDDANNLLVATGEVLPEISLDTEPGVEAQQAQQAALEKIAKDRELEVGALEATEPELWIYNPSLLGGPGPDVTRLVWRMEVTPAEGIVDFRELVLVDAKRGAVLLNFNQADTARDRNTYTMNNSDDENALPGTLVCDESNPTCSGGDADAVAAHLYASDTYDFYSSYHGRDSIDNAGMSMISSVHFGTNFNNAFWNGKQMVYGDGEVDDDTAAHEITHGVTDHESNLFYYYQSGAINESLSDVWGEFVDLTNAHGNDAPEVRWRLFEDTYPPNGLRNMQNPPEFGHPDSMQSPLYHPDERDNGGVHINSGVGNKAAYLMTDGDTFNGKTVTGLGIDKTAKIYYEAQANLLTSASDYQDLHSNLQQACTNLIGTSGITSADCADVKDAVDATEMNLIPTAAPTSEAPVCDTGQPTNLFSDNLENTSSGNWTTSGTGWYYPQNPNPYNNFDATYATSGHTNFWGDNRGVTSDHTITKATSVAVPTGTTYLRFNHAYGFEDSNTGTNNDGGVLEYSTNNGSTWQDAGSLITDNGYNGTISNSSGNPIGGREGFVAESNGYISSRVDLSSLAGQSVTFRFRIGEDSAGFDYGWFIDDVSVYTCGEPPTPNSAPTAADDSYTANEDTALTIPAPGVLDNDDDAEHDPLSAVLVSGPTHGTVTLSANGAFTYTPAPNYHGPDSFTYKANDGEADSDVATVSITVNDTNDPSSVEVSGGKCLSDTSAQGEINLIVGDDGGASNLILSVDSNNNTRLVPNNNITFGGSGENRTMTVRAASKQSGTAKITVKVSDGTNTTTLAVTVMVGTQNPDTITGTSGADIIFGLAGQGTLSGAGGLDLVCGGNGNDTISGGDGNDVLDGGRGDDVLNGQAGNDKLFGNAGRDTLTGGTDADSFSGGSGTDTATDFNAGQGDTRTGIP